MGDPSPGTLSGVRVARESLGPRTAGVVMPRASSRAPRVFQEWPHLIVAPVFAGFFNIY